MRSLLAYLVFRLGVGVVGLLPLRLAIMLGSLGGRLAGPLMKGRWEMVKRHAGRLGVPDHEARSHAGKVFAAYGRYWAEAFWVRPARRAEIEATTSVVGLQYLSAAQERGKGIVVALPHVGNWEFAGPVAGGLDLELVAVAENLANHHIRDWFVTLRGRMGIGVVLAKGSVMRELEAVVRRNGAVALLCDRDLRRRGIEVEFFGEKTTLPAGPVRLALETGAALLPVASYFLGRGHLVQVEPPIELRADTTIEEGTRLLAAALERLIRADPAQWHLLQPNWPSDREA